VQSIVGVGDACSFWCENGEACCLSVFCPCYLFGVTQQDADEGNLVGCCCCWLILVYFYSAWVLGTFQRDRIMTKYNVSNYNDPCPDGAIGSCMCHLFAQPCALAQESRLVTAFKSGKPPIIATSNTMT